LNFVGDTLSVSELIGQEILAFDHLASNLVRVIAGKMGNLPKNFGISGSFYS